MCSPTGLRRLFDILVLFSRPLFIHRIYSLILLLVTCCPLAASLFLSSYSVHRLLSCVDNSVLCLCSHRCRLFGKGLCLTSCTLASSANGVFQMFAVLIDKRLNMRGFDCFVLANNASVA